MTNKTLIAISLFMLVAIAVWQVSMMFTVVNTAYGVDSLMSYNEKLAMYNKSIRPLVRQYGIYFNDQYYCVWTEGRTLENIERTECHEIQHALIQQDNEVKDHFCGVEG